MKKTHVTLLIGIQSHLDKIDTIRIRLAECQDAAFDQFNKDCDHIRVEHGATKSMHFYECHHPIYCVPKSRRYLRHIINVEDWIDCNCHNCPLVHPDMKYEDK